MINYVLKNNLLTDSNTDGKAGEGGRMNRRAGRLVWIKVRRVGSFEMIAEVSQTSQTLRASCSNRKV